MTVIRRKSPLGEMLSLRQAVDRLSLPRGVKNDAAVASFDKPRQISITPADQNGKAN